MRRSQKRKKDSLVSSVVLCFLGPTIVKAAGNYNVDKIDTWLLTYLTNLSNVINVDKLKLARARMH